MPEGENTGRFSIFEIFGRFDSRLFHPINLTVDISQFFGVGCTKILSARFFSNFGQRFIINVDFHCLINLVPKKSCVGKGAIPLGARSNRINLHLHCRRQICRHFRRDTPGVISSIGQRYDYFTLGPDSRRRLSPVAIAEPIAVPSSNMPICARSRFCISQP